MSATQFDQHAIYIKNATKSYGKEKVINDFCMQVPRGCIYGLLGASGCGKTTLLKCLVNLKQFESGDIYVLGGTPGTPESGVPGPAIGYMPQDIALVAEFTVRDTVFYFGRINNVADWCIEERFKMLKALLDLPPDDRQMRNCSGGQQRRVSLAAALLHKPQLLILDEPTVGLDPVLRENIWNHLVDLAEKEQTTIIITTHYIEEARQAHKIGLMREGVLLIEESPERLLQLFNTDSFEEVFLILSRRQEERRHIHLLQDLVSFNVIPVSADANGSTDLCIPAILQEKQVINNINALSLNKRHLKSLMSKNTKQFLRNISGMVFTFSFPFLQILPFLMSIGREPKDLKLAIINDDAHFKQCTNYTKNGTAVPDGFGNCHFTNLACRFLNEIENPMFDMEYYNSLHHAFEDVRRGKVAGVLHMAQNYSEMYSNRNNNGRTMSGEDLDLGNVQIWLDVSSYHVGELLKKRLFELFQHFQMSAFENCNYSIKLGRIPMSFNFEYAAKGEDYTTSMLPGIILIMVFFLGTTLASTLIVIERKEGVWERCIVAGVSPLEIVITHFVTQFVVMLIVTGEFIILAFLVCEQPYEGDLYLIFVFILLHGLVGMAIGFCISVITDNLVAAALACTALFIPLNIICGCFWPLESQAASLRFITQCLPVTLPAVSLRHVIKKGYGLDNWQVWDGLIITVLWILIPSLLSLFFIKARR